jgi:molecular chaperone GrpE
MSVPEEQSQGPVIRDRRRIDPVTGQVREPAQSASGGQQARGTAQAKPGKHSASKPGGVRAAAAGSAGAEAAEAAEQGGPSNGDGRPGDKDDDLAVKLAERTSDLQRVQAEYANYRKRVDRDRAAVREFALAGVLSELLPVLDDIGRAREHEELTGGFKAVADRLESATAKLGLTTFGEPGETFDPNIHEALMHSYSPEVTEPTCVQVLQPGYKVGERILRAARVAVAEPSDPSGSRTANDDESSQDRDQGDEPGEAETADADAQGPAPDDGD